ncbi:hypothetical protein O181_095514 [Austropuccinia psidii MF-1]|uniref:Peptidase A2 domain-containing protein n=1 Tax=Austropuccinia psidii MF-1 TaxID=1389203 RepID=A0A9Q3PBT8_9BASI|nr:hypothetical protein [Austropuccinia psidii MF-1]
MKEDEAKEAPPKPNQMNIIQLKKDDSATSIAKGLRNTKERNSRAENTNQDSLGSNSKVKTPIKKQPNIPGAYIEDEKREEEKTIIPTKYKKPQMGKNENNIPSQEPKIDQTENNQELIKKINERKILKEEKLDIQEIMAQIIKKVLDQKINLTLEQILVMSPKFFNQLKNLSEEEKSSINSIDTKEIQTKLIAHQLGNCEQPKLHYAFPLGFMQVYLGEEGHEIMALVDTGSELNMIPEDSAIKAGLTTRCLDMNLTVIGGLCTSIVGLAEFTPITLVTGEERNIHLFVAREAVHTVLGRPFLADNNIRLDFSQQKGEIFSYIEPDGRILCLPICSPQKVGWRENPPAGMDACASATVEGYNGLNIEEKESFVNIGSYIKFFKNKEAPQEIQTLANMHVENKT